MNSWDAIVANKVNKYFKQPYADKPAILTVKHNGHTYTVNRPNHGLAHGLRQGFLAADIVQSLWQISQKNTKKFTSKDGIKLIKWVNKKMAADPFFLKKVTFASAFQRTGRQSEVSSSENLNLYKSYERADAKNFVTEAKSLGQKSPFSKTDLQVFKEAILWSTADEGKIDPKTNKDLYFLRKIFHTAHDLDLRRMLKFDINRMKASAVSELFGEETIDNQSWKVHSNFSNEQKYIDKLWGRSGEYLLATGDRDVVGQRKYNKLKYMDLAYNPNKMVKTLQKTRAASKISFK